jgi:hypothetical protein
MNKTNISIIVGIILIVGIIGWFYWYLSKLGAEEISTNNTSFEEFTQGNKGWIQVIPSSRYFQFENGEPFFPIGHNVGGEIFLLSDQELEEHFQDMKNYRENVLRFPVAAWIDDVPYLLEESC